MDNWRNAEKLLVVYPSDDTIVRHFMEQYLVQFGTGRRAAPFELISDIEVNDSLLARYPAMLIGHFSADSKCRELIDLPYFSWMNKGFSFMGKQFLSEDDILRLSFVPNARYPDRPLMLITGNSNSKIVAQFSSRNQEFGNYLLWDSWGYQIFHNGQRIMLGMLNDRFERDDVKSWEFDFRGKVIAHNEHFDFYDHNSGLSELQTDSIMAYTHRNITAFETVFGVTAGGPFAYHLLPSTEVKGLMYNNTDQSHTDMTLQAVYAVYEHEFGEHYSGTEMELIIADAFGYPKTLAMLKGLSATFNSKWEDKGSRYWALCLYQAGAAPVLHDILDADSYQQRSPLIMQACASLFTQYLLATYTPTEVRSLYNSATSERLMQEAEDYDSWIRKQLQTFEPEKQKKKSLERLQGFNFAHEGYNVYNGYLGSEARKSIDEMHNTGSNTMAIIPYSVTREMNKPMPFPIMQSAGSENDASVIKAAHEAQERGMVVMLKPQIWSHMGWPGDIAMKNEEDWSLFFSYYENWIMHYALLAEMYGIELFCAGVEFQQATLTHPEAWETLFRKIRSLYGGYLTYAANWGAEIEGARIWDQLDFISVNCYYPISKQESPTDEELLSGMEAVLDKLEQIDRRTDKPMMITEIGFKSIDKPWIQPHADHDEQGVNNDSQVRCYEAMFRALKDESWIQGIYLWQWPSYMDYYRHNPKGFTPAGKPAEEVVRKYFTNQD